MNPTDTQHNDKTRLAQVQSVLADDLKAAGRAPGACSLIVVSKTQSAERLAPLVQGQPLALGENYLSGAWPKIKALGNVCEWHFIGAIQSNKTADIAEHFDWVHTLDRLKIARRLNDQRPAGAKALKVLIQVNLDDEPQKAGCHPSELPELAAQIAALPNLELKGLMSIPKPNADDPGQPHRKLAQCLADLQAAHPGMTELSMGMSADMTAAVAAGATRVRIGTAIFGPRPPKDT